MSAIKIGIIGGSGLSNPDLLENRTEKLVDTPYGKVCTETGLNTSCIVCNSLLGDFCWVDIKGAFL